jgi:hypothetical protein
MGKKSKLKKERKEKSLSLPKTDLDPDKNLKSTEFVREIQNFGYQFAKLDRSPQLPEHKREPEI